MGIVAAAQIASVYYDARATAQRVAESIAERLPLRAITFQVIYNPQSVGVDLTKSTAHLSYHADDFF